MAGPASQLTAVVVRRVVATVCTGAVAGMIVSAATHHLGGVIALGCVASVAILALMTAVATSPRPATFDEERARRVEQLVAELVGRGADEEELRGLVGEAVRLGRGETESTR